MNKYRAIFNKENGEEFISIVYATSFGSAESNALDDLSFQVDCGEFTLSSITKIDFTKTFIRTKFGVLETFGQVDDGKDSIVVTLDGKRVCVVEDTGKELRTIAYERFNDDFAVIQTFDMVS